MNDQDALANAQRYLDAHREPVTLTPPDWPHCQPGDELGIRVLGQRHRSMIVESVDGTTLHLRPRTWRDLPRTLTIRAWRIAQRLAFRIADSVAERSEPPKPS